MHQSYRRIGMLLKSTSSCAACNNVLQKSCDPAFKLSWPLSSTTAGPHDAKLVMHVSTRRCPVQTVVRDGRNVPHRLGGKRASCRHLRLLCRWQSQRLVVMKRLASVLHPFVTPPLLVARLWKAWSGLKPKLTDSASPSEANRHAGSVHTSLNLERPSARSSGQSS
jgi:hypothetical protein